MRGLILALTVAVPLGAMILVGSGNTVDADTISIIPKATYLRTNNDPAQNTVPILLTDIGIAGGDLIRLEQLGDFDAGPGADDIISMMGVFSSSDVLLSASELNRVQDAIDAGDDAWTARTWYGNLPTDIDEDFSIDDITIQVPALATHLFVMAGDSLYYDNSDPDGDYAVRTTVVPEPSAVVWTGIGGTTWSTATGLNNWKDSGSSAVDYANGDDVTFNDTATGLTVDISAADVTPSSVLFDNSTKDFTVQGTYGIAGSTGLTKRGTGKATLTSANSYTGLTTVEAGVLKLGPNAQAPVLTGGGADIQGGQIILDYTGGSSPAADVRTALTASYAAGFVSGQIYSSTATSDIGLGWADDTGASELTIAYALYGDADLNGTVEFADLSKLLASYNQAGDWAQGDFDYSGAVAFADLSKLLANYGEILPSTIDVGCYNLDAAAIQLLSDAGITVVPEPSSLILLVMAGLGLLAYASRRRRD